MTGKGIFKRLAPFFLTLALGLFVASLFVDIASPTGFRARRINKMRKMDQLRLENDQLRRENSCLKRQLDAHRLDSFDNDDYTIAPVPPVKTDIPPPPPPRMHRVQ